MKISETLANRSAPLTQLLRVCAAALALGVPAVWPRVVHADVTPPPVPENLQVPPGYTAVLEGHAVGTQGYICQPSGAGFAWTFVKPQATLFDDNHEQIITHFLSTNQFESPVAPRPTWQDSRDTSRVWAMAMATSSDPTFVAAGAIPWLLLQVVGSQPGPTDGHTLTATSFIQRLNTAGGVAPSIGCDVSTVGNKVLVPYTADYFFFRAE